MATGKERAVWVETDTGAVTGVTREWMDANYASQEEVNAIIVDPNDAAVSGLIDDPESDTSAALAAEFAAKAIVDEHTTELASLPATYAPIGDPRLASFKQALDAGRSAALWVTGDSTIDYDQTAVTPHPFEVLAASLAAKYPSHHIRVIARDDSTDTLIAPVVVQAASGARYAQLTTRSLRYLHASAPAFTSGNFDVAVLLAADDWTPATTAVLLNRGRKGATSFSDAVQIRFRIKSTGVLSVNWSTNGTSYNGDKDSTVAPTITDGQPLWVRVTVEINTVTGWNVKFYTSPANDGATWTQLGTTVSFAGATTAMSAVASDAFFELGGYGWQPVGEMVAGKYYAVRIRDGVNGPLMAPTMPEMWERYPDSSTTFGGSPTVTIVNMGRSGQALSYHTDAARLAFETGDFGQSVLFFSDSHNEVGASGPVLWTDPYQAWVTAVRTRLPNAAVAVIRQNPHTSAWANEAAYGYNHIQRGEQLVALAAKNGWSVVDLYTAFLEEDPTGATLISSDGLHPTTAGYAFSAEVIERVLGFTP